MQEDDSVMRILRESKKEKKHFMFNILIFYLNLLSFSSNSKYGKDERSGSSILKRCKKTFINMCDQAILKFYCLWMSICDALKDRRGSAALFGRSLSQIREKNGTITITGLYIYIYMPCSLLIQLFFTDMKMIQTMTHKM